MDRLLIGALLAAFAGFRLAHLLIDEEGPFNVFGRFRALLGIPYEGEVHPRLFGNVLLCFWCLSVWTSVICYAFGRLVSWEPVAAIAAAGIAAMANELRRRP